MDLSFDDVLNNTADAMSGAAVVSINNDVNSIAVEEDTIQQTLLGMTNGKYWDAAEYGITAEEAAAMLEAANTPEARETVITQLKERAIRRASLDISNGKVALLTNIGKNGKLTPWHKLGKFVDKAMTVEEVRKLWDDFEVKKVATKYEHNGQLHNNESDFVIIRTDTGARLGSTGSKYKCIQNAEGFSFMDAILKDYGAKFETVGSIFGGKKVWMQCQLPGSFEVTPGDVNYPLVTFVLDHSGKGAVKAFITEYRAVCANTLNLAFSSRDERQIAMRHDGDIGRKVESAKRVLGIAAKKSEEFSEHAKQMAKTPVNHVRYANAVLDQVLAVTEAESLKGANALAAALCLSQAEHDAKVAQIDRDIKYRKNLLEEIFRVYETETCNPKGSVWSAFNAITETADHSDLNRRKVGSVNERESRRFESILAGKSNEMKQQAYAQAMKTISA